MTLASDVDNLMDGLLATFSKKLVIDLEDQAINTYLQGSAQMTSWADKAGIDIPFEGPPIASASRYAEAHCANMVKGMDKETKKRLARIISDGIENKRGIPGLTKDIKAEFEDMANYRAKTIARTETSDALGEAFMDRSHEMEIQGKEWVWGGDICDICRGNEAAGIIGIDALFPSGHVRPPAHPNCICALAPARLPKKKASPKAPRPSRTPSIPIPGREKK